MRSIVLAVVCCVGCSGAEEPRASTTGPLMRPGDNCLRCHEPSSDVGAPEWTAAGTVFPSHDAPTSGGVEDVTVMVTDAEGKSAALLSNAAGNFYTNVPLTAPLHVVIEHDGQTLEMPVPAPAGSCNACHSKSPVGGTRGRIYVPGSPSDESQATCDGDHTVSLAGGSDYDCAPYRCVKSPRHSCLFACADSDDCVGGATCVAGRCS